MANQVGGPIRPQLDALLRIGPTAGLSDGQLLDLVGGPDLGSACDSERAEAAFAALVERHGPMVRQVCRDVAGHWHDAEDACQAVFLILARQAGSVRHRDSAAGWLFGVARRVALRARRDAHRRREHERRRADEQPRPAREVAPPDAWQVLHDEVARLPDHYRGPVVLCHLEGLTHEAAAQQLGCPVRTVQSRLLRARGRLRAGLTRRGVGPQAGAFALVAGEHGMHLAAGPLAHATARHALAFAAGKAAPGTVPGAAGILAEGVLRMATWTRCQWWMTALAGVGLTASLAWAAARGPDPAPAFPPPPTAAPNPTQPAPAPQPEPGRPEARGIVVDEAGRPVAGVEVMASAFTVRAAAGVSGPDGTFLVAVSERQLDGLALLARTPGDDRLGVFRYGGNLTRAQAEVPARIVLKPARRVAVRVVGADKQPVPGATVEAGTDWRTVARRTTDADGRAELRLPLDSRVERIVAMQPSRGLDYAEFGPNWKGSTFRDGIPAADLPPTVDLALERGQPLQIRAVDLAGRPLGGVKFGPWGFTRAGRRSTIYLADDPTFEVTTGPDGMATFDWMPPTTGVPCFIPRSEGYARRRVVFEDGATGPITARVGRTEAIRGRVVRPDGTPAEGIAIRAVGTGLFGSLDQGGGQTRSGPDGSYEMIVDAGEGYAVSVDNPDWAAPSRLDVHVREGQPALGVDFAMTKGTVVRGTVTLGAAARPVPDVYLLFSQRGEQGPMEPNEDGRPQSRQIRRSFMVPTDAQGRYSTRVGPGTYSISGPMRAGVETLVVAAEPELVRDFRMPRPMKGPLVGQVVAAATGQALAGAAVEIVALNDGFDSLAVATDAAGRFQAERWLDHSLVCARSADGTLGAVVEIGAEDAEVSIPLDPTASAAGVLLDEQGKPLANQPLHWGQTVDAGGFFRKCFGPAVATDAAGRFVLPGLIIGQSYDVGIARKDGYPEAAVVRAATPGPIDLGTVRLHRAWTVPNAELSSSFRTDGPGVGDPAPAVEATTLDGAPLRLADFRGKFVLLDFWATWCGPCLGEIPYIRAIHEEFAAGGRLAVLGISLDDAADAPRRFQADRQLPWAQGFVAGGLRSATPDSFGVRAIPALVLVDPAGRIVAKGMRGDEIRREVARALAGKAE